jgi:capsid portal protein
MSELMLKAYVVGSEESPGRSRQLPEAAWVEAYASGEVIEPPYDLDALAQLYETNAAHKACVDANVKYCKNGGQRTAETSGEGSEPR